VCVCVCVCVCRAHLSDLLYLGPPLPDEGATLAGRDDQPQGDRRFGADGAVGHQGSQVLEGKGGGGEKSHQRVLSPIPQERKHTLCPWSFLVQPICRMCGILISPSESNVGSGLQCRFCGSARDQNPCRMMKLVLCLFSQLSCFSYICMYIYIHIYI